MRKILIIYIFLTSFFSFSQEIKFGKVSKAELEEKFYPLDSTTDAAYLYKYRKTYFEYASNHGFIIRTDIHERIKIYNKKGLNEATKSLVYYKPKAGKSDNIYLIKASVYNLINNKIIKDKILKENIFVEKINDTYSKRKLTFPNVNVGSVLEIKYTKISYYYNKIEDLLFQYNIPIKKLLYKIEIPEYLVFNVISKGINNVKQIKSEKVFEIDGPLKARFRADVIEYRSENIPKLINTEPYIYDVNEYTGTVKFELAETNFKSFGGKITKYTTNWEKVCKQIFKHSRFGEELSKTKYYKKDFLNLLSKTKSDSLKIFSILKFIKSRIKWNGVYGKFTIKGVKKAFKENNGNVAELNLMLTSMLRSAGLNANPVLVSSRGNGIPSYPTIEGFDYVISKVTFPDNSFVLLDATEPYSLPNILPERALNWNGRVVESNGNSSWVKLNPKKHSLQDNIINVKITDDLLIEGFIRTKYNNLNALNFRKKYNHLKEENLITNFEETYNVEVENFKVLNKNNLGKPINRIVKFSSEDLIEEINGKFYLEPLLFLTRRENPFKLEERKFPVDFTIPWKEKNTVSIQLPKGYKVESLPEVLAIGLPEKMGFFKYQVSQVGNRIKVMSILQFNTPIISPEYYKSLKDFYGDLVKKQTEKIVLIKQ